MAYTGVYVFGDSLVDSGNALKLARMVRRTAPDRPSRRRSDVGQGLFPRPLLQRLHLRRPCFEQGRSASSPSRSSLIDFEDPWLGIPIAPFASDPNGNNLNFAYGGSHIRHGDEVVPDLDEQTDAFRDAVDGDAPPGALYIVTTGGNDVRDLAPTGSDPVSQAEAYAELQRCADKLLHELGQIVDDGAHQHRHHRHRRCRADPPLRPRWRRRSQRDRANAQRRRDRIFDLSRHADPNPGRAGACRRWARTSPMCR